MKRLIILALAAVAVWQGYGAYHSRHAKTASLDGEAVAEINSAPNKQDVEGAPQFKCDGRTYCSQMTSCAEATYFLRNCPGVKMDGNNDGVPCEQQWCRK